jgi:hypothetical protein
MWGMVASSQYPHAGNERQEICRFLLPSESEDVWLLDIPAELEKCVGRYARIPEFVRGTHILSAVKLSQEQAP